MGELTAESLPIHNRQIPDSAVLRDVTMGEVRSISAAAVRDALTGLRAEVQWFNPLYFGEEAATAVRTFREEVLRLIDAGLPADPE